MDFFNRKSTYFKIGPDVSHTLKSFTFLVSGTRRSVRRQKNGRTFSWRGGPAI